MNELVTISRDLCDRLAGISPEDFDERVGYIYRPVRYAWDIHRQYLETYGASTPREVLLIGMNPGPWGMGQTGVPFGDVDFVGDWMGLQGEVEQPERVNPKKPVDGLDCPRNEVSGSRLWGWAKERFGPAENFFERFYVHNYCPLLFLEDGGRNCAPSRMLKAQREMFTPQCDEALRRIIAHLRPAYVLGVGNYARDRIKKALADWEGDFTPVVDRILHPSPASPKANQGWAEQAEAQLAEIGVEL